MRTKMHTYLLLFLQKLPTRGAVFTLTEEREARATTTMSSRDVFRRRAWKIASSSAGTFTRHVSDVELGVTDIVQSQPTVCSTGWEISEHNPGQPSLTLEHMGSKL